MSAITDLDSSERRPRRWGGYIAAFLIGALFAVVALGVWDLSTRDPQYGALACTAGVNQ